MPLLTDEAEARARLESGCSWDSDPALSETDITQLLDRFKVAEIWSAATVYAYGDVVIPATRNGRRYRVIKTGTGVATEPTWPDYNSGQVTDGTATLEEIGPEIDLWDIQTAIHEGWKLKAAKASEFTSYAIGSNRAEQQMVYDHCIQMMHLHTPIRVA